MKLLSRGTLLQLIIAKSIIEALVVTAVAASFYFASTNPNLRGWLDQADARTVAGWAVDESNPGRRVEVELFIDDKLMEQRLAADFRPDVHRAQRAVDDWHGFVFQIPPLAAGEHEVRVYVVHSGASPSRRTLQIIGKPLRFSVESSAGSLTPEAQDAGGQR